MRDALMIALGICATIAIAASAPRCSEDSPNCLIGSMLVGGCR